MILAKTRLLTIAVASSLLLSSCIDDRKEERKDFALSSRIQSLEYEGGSLWGIQAETGVFVLETGSAKVIGENCNIRYTTEFKTGLNQMSPADEPIVLPEDGEHTDIVVYYPYTSELNTFETASYTYDVDLTDQQNRKPDILLTGKATDCNTAINAATVTLKPVFSKLNLRLRIEYETKATAGDITVSINNIPGKATIDVLTGEYLSYGEKITTVMSKPFEKIYAYEAVILAHTVDKDAELVVQFPNDSAEETLKVNLKKHIKKFEQNSQYDLDVTVSPEGLNAVLVSMSDFYVSDWYEDIEDINGKVNKKDN